MHIFYDFYSRALKTCRMAVLFGVASAFAQTSTPLGPQAGTSANTSDKTILMDAFHVSATAVSPYASDSANGAGRIAMSLLDTPESIDVIPQQFLNDIGGTSMLAATRFTAGTTEGQFSNRLDRITMRGFQQDPSVSAQYIDGFRYSGAFAAYNQDPGYIDRIEVIKGPNAILAASGSPGGAMNIVTKSPSFTPEDYFKVQAGQYLSDRAELDITGPLPWGDGKSMAYRIVAVYANSTGYMGDEFDRHYYIAPSFTWEIDRNTQVTIKGMLAQNFVTAPQLDIDPRVGPNDPVVLYPGLKARSEIVGPPSVGGIPGNRQYIEVEATHMFSDKFQMRFGGMALSGCSNSANGAMSGITTQTGNINPSTGQYTPGTTWTVNNYGLPNQSVTSTATAFPDFGNRNATYFLQGIYDSNSSSVIQNDYVYKTDVAPGFNSTSVAGWAATTLKFYQLVFNNKTVPLVGTIGNPDWGATLAELLAQPSVINTNNTSLESSSQCYVSEIFRAFQDRLVVSANLAYYEYRQRFNAGAITTQNPIKIAVPVGNGYASNAYYATPGYDHVKGDRVTRSGGIVYKPLNGVSVWAGYSENVNPPVINNLGSTSNYNQYGSQYEGGIKTALDGGKINLTACYFHIDEHNVFVYDFTTNSYLPLGDVISKGYEFEANTKIAHNTTLIGAFSAYKARNGFGQLLRSVPDTSGALAIRYSFSSGVLKNLWIMPSANYLGRRAGDIPGTITIASAVPGLNVSTVNGRDLNGDPVQPTFYLPARTIVDLNAGYSWGPHWVFWMRVANLFNKQYIDVALNRSAVMAGVPINVTGFIEYKF